MELINLNQTAKERKEKYWLVRSHNVPAHLARAMRDWRMTNIERRIGYIEAIYNPDPTLRPENNRIAR